VPTVENLAQIAFDILKGVFHDRYGRALRLSKLVLFETPNCWAEINDPAS
jgi:6-pyruvoyltetrahydropterin/6-carboxytetrahydropterin synthase